MLQVKVITHIAKGLRELLAKLGLDGQPCTDPENCVSTVGHLQTLINTVNQDASTRSNLLLYLNNMKEVRMAPPNERCPAVHITVIILGRVDG